ncbi:MAG: ferritin-like domain-containing protein [Blastocatellia bacterium]
MEINNDKAISTLNNLIETCRDGQTGFQSAAEGVDRNDLKRLLEQYSSQRGQFVAELQGLVLDLGEDPQETGSVAAALHRGWINIKSVVTGKNEHSILAECERGEDSAKKNYEEALQESLGLEISGVLRRQYKVIKDTHDHIRNLRDKADAANV